MRPWYQVDPKSSTLLGGEKLYNIAAGLTGKFCADEQDKVLCNRDTVPTDPANDSW